MRTALVVLITLMFAPQGVADTKKTKTHVWVDAQHTSVCWYEERRYSEGAVIDMFGAPKICARKYPNQDNGALIWRAVDKQGHPVYPEQQGKIRVH
ncbi:DUF1496 domain-containing protein [Pseudoalteromonas ruthenica]|uniref:DUF1496 domain-containing protein n=1 Tax=Pseudoalteromonas ruthenica TaxID=151081 RepID=A0A5S3Z0X5_9GAMM|nr:DUF1496 domain-containing protein [Pseudoalteromonas ruthenica]TMP85671.1 DUF1496 domain-containing protein [Pseudoalteromonas ruthenica]